MQNHESAKKIIGIDPGTQTTGYGVLKVTPHRLEVIDFGCIRTKSSQKISERYLNIFEGVSELIAVHNPIALAIETQFVQKNPQSAIKLGMARGVAILAATLKAVSIFEYAPTKAKKAVVGHGRASKYQIQAMVKTLLCLSAIPEPEDAADALAIAICHAHTMKFNLHSEHEI